MASATAQRPEARPASRPAAPLHRGGLRRTGWRALLGIVALSAVMVAAVVLLHGVVQQDLDAAGQAAAAGDNPAAVLLALDTARHDLDGATVAIACLAWLGVTTLGAVALLFFSRMADDITALRTRALAIVGGERSAAAPLRAGEIGELAQALDSLAAALERHERDLEIERRNVLHQERLAAIGGMAAGVLREIGNPIAAIDGFARAMLDAREHGECGDCQATAGSLCDPTPILHETTRLLRITHEIASLAAPPAAHRQLASLNDIVTQALALLRYEPRLDAVALHTALDAQLPALECMADRLLQLLINLVINAADATAALAPRSARIEVVTRHAPGGVELSVTDNGSGMDDAVRARAFEPLFTTKPAGRGTGLGLPLCHAIAQEHGGRINIDTGPGQGTRVTVWLPLHAARLAATVGA